jgi:hypothetical protein
VERILLRSDLPPKPLGPNAHGATLKMAPGSSLPPSDPADAVVHQLANCTGTSHPNSPLNSIRLLWKLPAMRARAEGESLAAALTARIRNFQSQINIRSAWQAAQIQRNIEVEERRIAFHRALSQVQIDGCAQ